MRERSRILWAWTTETPEPLEATQGWRHTPTAEAAGMRLVAAFSLRPSAAEGKAGNGRTAAAGNGDRGAVPRGAEGSRMDCALAVRSGQVHRQGAAPRHGRRRPAVLMHPLCYG